MIRIHRTGISHMFGELAKVLWNYEVFLSEENVSASWTQEGILIL